MEAFKHCKLSVFKSIIVPILTHDHKFWVTTERILPKEQTAEMGYLRSVLGVTLRDKVRSCEIRKTLNVKPILLRSRDPSYVGSATCPEFPAG